MQKNEQHVNHPVDDSMDKSHLNSQYDYEVTITVCVGSSCYLRGSYEIIKTLKELIKSSDFRNKVLLKGSFCMENCTEGVSVKIDEELFSIGSIDEMKKIFQNEVASAFGR